MEISEYKRRKAAGKVELIKVNKDRTVLQYPVYDQATGEVADLHQRSVDAVQVRAQIAVLTAQLADLQELLNDIEGLDTRN